MGERAPRNAGSGSSASAAIRVLVVDDHPVVRKALTGWLRQDGLTVIAEARDGHEAVDRLAERAADVMLLDAETPGMDGAEATRAIHRRWPDLAVIALSLEYTPTVERMMTAGATSFLPKQAEPDTVTQAVASAAATAKSRLRAGPHE